MSGYLYVMYQKYNFVWIYTFNSISVMWKKWKKAHFFPNINFFKAIFSMGEKVMFKTEDQF